MKTEREKLIDFVNGFYKWHSKTGFFTIQKIDWFDYIKSINFSPCER